MRSCTALRTRGSWCGWRERWEFRTPRSSGSDRHRVSRRRRVMRRNRNARDEAQRARREPSRSF